MKNHNALAAFVAAAVLLLAACDNKAPETPADSEQITTTTAPSEASADEAVPVEKTEATKTSASATAAGLEGERDTKKTENELVTDLGSVPYGDYVGKQIKCDDRDAMNLHTDWKLDWGDVPDEKGNITIYNGNVTGYYRNYDFSPITRFSSGALSDKCDESFKASVASAASANIGRYNHDDVFELMSTTIHVTGVDKTYVYADEIKAGLKTKVYDDMIVVKGFIRRAKEKKGDNAYNDDQFYEYIIDPAYMRYMGLPMLESDPERMKFTINGREIYADTVHGYGCPVSYIANGEIFSQVQSSDYIYATIVLMGTSFTYDNVNGALANGSIMTIEPITDDTGAVLDGSFAGSSENEKLINALDVSKGSMIGDDTLTVDLIDLDFDGTPEVLVGYCDDAMTMEGPDATMKVKIYKVSGSFMNEIGEFEIGDYGSCWFDEAIYLPDGTHGWHFMDFKYHCFLTLKNGKLDIKKLIYGQESGQTDEYGYPKYDYYYLGEKIKLEPYEAVNPLTGMKSTFYKWISGNSLGYSVMSDNPYAVFDMLHDSLFEDFRRIRRYDLDPKCDIWGDGSSVSKTGRFENYYVPSASFPNDIVDAYYTSERDKEFEKFYGLSYEGAQEKPVIYLYPEEQTDVTVKVEFPLGGELTCTYPQYNDGWSVTAMPDGTLYDANGDEYYCLYWEGVSRDTMDSSKGFCVKGSDTAAFLREKLMYIGLTAREANEFIIYWLPRMQDNEYNVITLHTADYARSVPLDVSPAPDSVIRVFMTYYASDEPVDIPGQELPRCDRDGFTLVEWGGTEEN